MSYAYNQKKKRQRRLRKGLCPVCRTPLKTQGLGLANKCENGCVKIDWSQRPPRIIYYDKPGEIEGNIEHYDSLREH